MAPEVRAKQLGEQRHAASNVKACLRYEAAPESRREGRGGPAVGKTGDRARERGT